MDRLEINLTFVDEPIVTFNKKRKKKKKKKWNIK